MRTCLTLLLCLGLAGTAQAQDPWDEDLEGYEGEDVFEDEERDDDDSANPGDDDDSAFFASTVPLEDRVLGGGCDDGEGCSVGGSAPSGLALLLLAGALRRRR